MSFEANYIDRDNYQEYFILYIDNELSAGERAVVEDFLAANADLEVEMDLLMSTKLPMETVSFADKTELMAEQMKMDAFGDRLLLYMDNELDVAEKNVLEKELASVPEYRAQYQMLLQTKLNAAEAIFYPNKKELYRTKKVLAFPIIRAASVLLIMLTSAYLLLFNRTSSDMLQVVSTPPPTIKQSVPPEQKPSASPAENIAAVIKYNKKSSNKIICTEHLQSNVVTENSIAPEQKQTDVAPIEVFKLPAPDVATNITGAIAGNKIPVTKESTVAYNTSESSSQNDADPDNGKNRGGSFKGFLRKATRLIERNTGIAATNDDNQLLIGAVAVKLK